MARDTTGVVAYPFDGFPQSWAVWIRRNGHPAHVVPALRGLVLTYGPILVEDFLTRSAVWVEIGDKSYQCIPSNDNTDRADPWISLDQPNTSTAEFLYLVARDPREIRPDRLEVYRDADATGLRRSYPDADHTTLAWRLAARFRFDTELDQRMLEGLESARYPILTEPT
jgi:hypothetical protein